MRRFLILVAAIIAFSSSASAVNNEYSFFSKLNDKNRFERLAGYLQANSEQQGYLKEIFALSAKKVDKLRAKESVSEKELKKAMAFNLVHVKGVLSSDQYRKYLIILNISMNNANAQNDVVADN